MTKCPNFILNILINKQYHVTVLLKRFYLNCNTIGFHPQTYKLELRTKETEPCEKESSAKQISFEWPHRKILSADSKVRTTYKSLSFSVRLKPDQRACGMVHCGPCFKLHSLNRLLAISTKFGGSDVQVSPVSPPLVAVDISFP